MYSLGQTLQGRYLLLEAGNTQQKELSRQRANCAGTPRMKIAVDVSSIVSKQDPPHIIELSPLWRISFTVSQICAI